MPINWAIFRALVRKCSITIVFDHFKRLKFAKDYRLSFEDILKIANDGHEGRSNVSENFQKFYEDRYILIYRGNYS